MRFVYRANRRSAHDVAFLRVIVLAAGTAWSSGGACAQHSAGDADVTPATAARAAGTVEYPEAAAGTARAPGEDAPAAQGEGVFRGVRMELGPVRWGGSLGQQYQWTRSSEPARSHSRIDTAHLTAASYIGQPWLAQVRGGLGVLHTASQSAAGEPPATVSSSSDSTNLTGDAALALFPVSRFPLDAYASVSDSRTSGELSTADFRNRKFGARQTYRSADDRTRYTARFDQSELSSATFGRDTLEVVEAGVTTRRAEHSFDLNAAASANRGGRDGTDADTRRASARHGYAAGTALSVESLASLNRSTAGSSNALAPAVAASQVRQVSSFGTWRPDEGDPLYRDGRPLMVTASARLLSLETANADAALGTQTANGTLGASYAMSAHARAAANLSATQSSAGGTRTRATSQNANLAYTPDVVRLGAYSYAWNLTAAAGNVTASGSAARQTAALQAGHNLSRGEELLPGARVVLTLGQGAGLAHDASGNLPTLNHSAGVTASSSGGTAISYVGLTATDARSFGEARSTFQLVNLQATRQHPLTALSYWSGNFTVQGTRQRDERVQSDFAWTRTGGLAYRHQRAFDVARLRFSATYTASSQQLASRASGDIDAPREFTSQAAEARLEYGVGKLELALSARTALIENRRNSMLLLRAQRQL